MPWWTRGRRRQCLDIWMDQGKEQKIMKEYEKPTNNSWKFMKDVWSLEQNAQKIGFFAILLPFSFSLASIYITTMCQDTCCPPAAACCRNRKVKSTRWPRRSRKRDSWSTRRHTHGDLWDVWIESMVWGTSMDTWKMPLFGESLKKNTLDYSQLLGHLGDFWWNLMTVLESRLCQQKFSSGAIRDLTVLKIQFEEISNHLVTSWDQMTQLHILIFKKCPCHTWQTQCFARHEMIPSPLA